MTEPSPAPNRGIRRKALGIVLIMIVGHIVYSNTRNDHSWENEDCWIKHSS